MARRNLKTATLLTLALLAVFVFAGCHKKSHSPNPFLFLLGMRSGGAGATDNNSFFVGGTVSGLSGGVLKLTNNGGEEISVSANGPFGFHGTLGSGAAYDVQVSAQPVSPVQTCTASSNTGVIAAASVGTVTVVCSTQTFTVGGTVSGLLGSGLKLTVNGGDEISISADGSFTFPTAIADGSGYNVQVSANPTGLSQTCTPAGNTGTLAGSNVTTVSIVCATNSYTVGGTVTGLAGIGLQLKNNGGDFLTITGNGTFTFATSIADGAAFNVLVHQQPAGLSQTCTPASNVGTLAGANVTTVAIHCVTNSFTIGGTVTGLSGSGLKLTNNSGDQITVTGTGSVPFSFPTSLVDGSAFDVQVSAQPTSPGQVCVPTGNTGNLAGANVGSVSITCTTNTYTIGGTVSGLSGSGLQLKNNGGDTLTISGNGDFTFATAINDGQAYNVTVSAQPSGQSCSVTGGNPGTVSGGNVTGVDVTCSTLYTMGGRVSGLVGTLVLQNNLGDNKTITADGAFVFDTALVNGSAYSVTVLSKPAAQSCSVVNGSGTMGSAPVSNVYVYCFTTGDTTAPTVVSTTPTNAATAVSPLGATITVVFSEPMRVGLTPTLTTESYYPMSMAWYVIPNTGTTFTWTNATTLTITLSWIRFPEQTQLRWTLAAANLQDAAGNAIAAAVQRTFTTGFHSVTFPVADTGQTTCYDVSAPQGCGVIGWMGQDADYPNTPNARSFTGPSAHAAYTSDYTTGDNVTGLVWATCTAGLSGAACAAGAASTYTWYNAVNACAAMNTANGGAGYAGRTNWRLPTRQELETLTNFGVNSPAIDTTYFPGTVSSYYWVGTNAGYPWHVDLNEGVVYFNLPSTNTHYVRCVAAP